MADADFSEQYMQWSVKNQVGAYRNSEGSNGDSNLDSVVDYGTVKEADWPYESAPWTATNDAACTGGENLPTKCYTNGEPPASAVNGTKFTLPSNRWVNTTENSLKAHLTTKKTGVVVGMTFFYQSWNHRRSALPVNAEYWRKGYVTYPNAEDKTKSAEQRAGHAILIIGWDDELEVAMRDKDGNPILDGEGRPRVEKGFWLFKNSWGTAGFGVEHASGAGYGWLSYKYVSEYGNGAIAEPPTSVMPEREMACDDGNDNDRDGDTDCDDSDCAANAACSSNPTAHTYDAQPERVDPGQQPDRRVEHDQCLRHRHGRDGEGHGRDRPHLPRRPHDLARARWHDPRVLRRGGRRDRRRPRDVRRRRLRRCGARGRVDAPGRRRRRPGRRHAGDLAPGSRR